MHSFIDARPVTPPLPPPVNEVLMRSQRAQKQLRAMLRRMRGEILPDMRSVKGCSISAMSIPKALSCRRHAFARNSPLWGLEVLGDILLYIPRRQ